MNSSTILDFLRGQFPQASTTTLRRMIQSGRVTMAGQPVRSLKEPVLPGQKPTVGDSAGHTGAAEQEFPDSIRTVYSDSDILVVIKPAGLLTATHSEERRPTLLASVNRILGKHNQKRIAHLVHRLDRDASGLLVLARNVRALAELKRQFRTHTITREYELLVHGTPRSPAGRLEHRLLETESGLVRVCPNNPKIENAAAGKPAILDYQVIQTHGGYSLIRCRLHTGRKHQIRVQFAAIGHPVVGDVFYGTSETRRKNEGELCLHAVHIQLTHPRTKRVLDLKSTLPESMMRQMKSSRTNVTKVKATGKE